MRLLLQLQFAKVVVRPLVGEVGDFAGRVHSFGRVQAVEQNPPLKIAFPQIPESEPKGVFHEQGSRRPYLFRDFLHQGQGDRR